MSEYRPIPETTLHSGKPVRVVIRATYEWEKLEAERDRYQEALERIAEAETPDETAPGEVGYGMVDLRDLARAALDPEGEGNG